MTSTIKYFIKRSCKYKRKHTTLKNALIALIAYRDQNIDVDSCYKCVVCNHYHIGYYPKDSKKRKRARYQRNLYLRRKSNV